MSNAHGTQTGIEERLDAKGARAYRARVYDRRSARQIRGPWTSSRAAARAWRIDALAALQAGSLSAERGVTVRVAAEEFLAGIESGAIRTRSGSAYKPSAARGYRRELTNRVLPAFGAAHLAELTLPDMQRWADRLSAEGLAPSTVRNIITSARALYGWALPRGMAKMNPTTGLRLPTGGRARDRIAAPAEAAKLIAALAPRDQAALALAVYGGLRLGEVLALEWAAIDLAARRIRVVRSWDHGARQFVSPKSRAGVRTVPILDCLALLLSDHRVLTNQADGLLFPGRLGDRPVSQNALRDRMSEAWRRAELPPLGLQEARHTFASLMIAAGVNAKALSTYMGHSNIAITFDRYGHLMPGNEQVARGLADAYLASHDE